eukprot:COSAG01_NODE_12740_length_1692_cov_1.251726_3_plen_61_part_00
MWKSLPLLIINSSKQLTPLNIRHSFGPPAKRTNSGARCVGCIVYLHREAAKHNPVCDNVA